MTEGMNFFQSIFMFKNFAPTGNSTAENKLANSLKSEARQLAAIADQEMRNGNAARDLAFDSANQENSRVFAEIALWHHNRAGRTLLEHVAVRTVDGKALGHDTHGLGTTRRVADANTKE